MFTVVNIAVNLPNFITKMNQQIPPQDEKALSSDDEGFNKLRQIVFGNDPYTSRWFDFAIALCAIGTAVLITLDSVGAL